MLFVRLLIYILIPVFCWLLTLKHEVKKPEQQKQNEQQVMAKTQTTNAPLADDFTINDLITLDGGHTHDKTS